MVTVDDTLTEAAPGAQRRWQHPRLLLLLAALALGLSINALFNDGAWLEKGGLPRIDWAGALDSGRGVLGLESQDWDHRKVCGRMLQIVESSCGMKQRDHDTAGIQACIATELQYTMWSPYGCQ